LNLEGDGSKAAAVLKVLSAYSAGEVHKTTGDPHSKQIPELVAGSFNCRYTHSNPSYPWRK